jgi:hypothetical protein
MSHSGCGEERGLQTRPHSSPGLHTQHLLCPLSSVLSPCHPVSLVWATFITKSPTPGLLGPFSPACR